MRAIRVRPAATTALLWLLPTLALLAIATLPGCDGSDGGRDAAEAANAPPEAGTPSKAAGSAAGDDGPVATREGDGRRRVFVFGIDGASPLVVRPQMRSGRLPNLARLAREGVYRQIRSEHPLYSPRIWNSIVTGKDPSEHGITAFVHRDEEDHKHLYLSTDRRVPALWNIASAAGYSVGVVNFWTTWPPEVVNGVMVSDHFFPKQSELIRNTFQAEGEVKGALVYPESWASAAEAARTDDAPLVAIGDPFEHPERLPSWVNAPLLSQYYRSDGQITRVALAVEEAFSPDLTMVFLPGIDRVSHWLWGNLEPAEKYPAELRPTEDERNVGASALVAYYMYTDRLLGRLLAATDGDDLVIVVSDHGFEAQVSMMLLTGGHETDDSVDGVLFARGPGIAPGTRPPGGVSVLDVTPTVLAWMGIPPAEDMKGRPMSFVRMDVPEMVASHDGLAIERLEVGASGAEGQIVEQLRALGYLEGGGVDEGPTAPDDETTDGADRADAAPEP